MLKQVQAAVEKGLLVFDNPVVRTVFVTFVALYAFVLAPRVTSGVKEVFDSTWFKVVFFFVVILLAHKDPRLALIVALAFVFTMQGLAKYNVQEKIQQLVGSSGPAVIPAPHVASPPAAPPAPPPAALPVQQPVVTDFQLEPEVQMEIHDADPDSFLAGFDAQPIGADW